VAAVKQALPINMTPSVHIVTQRNTMLLLKRLNSTHFQTKHFELGLLHFAQIDE
jgi:hypothetical protein